MDVTFETQHGSSFSIEVGFWDTVLDIKKRIEKYQHIPVSEQILAFQGIVLQDDLEVEQTQILHNSRLHLFVFSLGNDHNRHQNEQPPLPSTSIGDIIYGEELPLTTEHFINIQSWPVTTDEKINNQDSQMTVGENNYPVLQTHKSPPLNNSAENNDVPVAAVGSSNNNSQVPETEQSPPLNLGEQSNNKNSQVLQTHQSPPLRNSSEENDLPVKVGSSNNNSQVLEPTQSPKSDSVIEIINVPDSRVKKRISNGNKVEALETEQPTTLNSGEQLTTVQDSLAKAGKSSNNNKNDQVPETEQPLQSNSNKRITDSNPWSPVKVMRKCMTVYVLPPSGESKHDTKIPVGVRTKDNVKELRKELVKVEEKGQLKLPEEGYFFRHKQCAVDEDQSFLHNGVAPNDTIEIVPGNVTGGAAS